MQWAFSCRRSSASGAGAPAETPRRIVLQVDGDSRLQLVGPEGGPAAPIGSRGELDQALGGVLADAVPEEIVVEIRADRDARHGVAVELLQYLRLRGFVQIQLLATGTRQPFDDDLRRAGQFAHRVEISRIFNQAGMD